MQPDIERFVALVRRELAAREVLIVPAETGRLAPADDDRELRCHLPDGRVVVATFDAPPDDREPKQRRLEMLASTLGDLAEPAAPKRPSRPPASQSLHQELKALCARAGSVNALVIDANSPVIWGAARSQGLGDEWPVVGGDPDDEAEAPEAASARPASVTPIRPAGPNEPRASSANEAPPLLRAVPDPDPVAVIRPAAPADDAARAGHVDVASRTAIEATRSLGELAALRKGKHLRHVEREGKGPFVAHSFAGIYLLVVAYAAPFDELRAERAIVESLPRIEQLVLALPPLDPSPSAGAAAMAVRRRKRR